MGLAEPEKEKIMPNATIVKEKFHFNFPHFTQAEPIDLFNRFYAAFGFIITISLYTACFKTLNSQVFDDLLPLAIAVVPVWGLVYGAWFKRQTWAWSLLTLLSIGSLISLGFHALGRPEMFVAFWAAEGISLFWLFLTGMKLWHLRDQ
jgi:hypothetical protein